MVNATIVMVMAKIEDFDGDGDEEMAGTLVTRVVVKSMVKVGGLR